MSIRLCDTIGRAVGLPICCAIRGAVCYMLWSVEEAKRLGDSLAGFPAEEYVPEGCY